MWGCSSLPPPSDDDDDNSSGAGNNGQGGTNSTGGKAGSGSAGSAGTAACVAPNQICSGVCTNVAADSLHCGNCGGRTCERQELSSFHVSPLKNRSKSAIIRLVLECAIA